jgi:hypothetical protein
MFNRMISECCGQLIVMNDVCIECREHCDVAESVDDICNMFVDRLRDINPEALLIDDMDRAIIGIDEKKARAVYSVELIISELMRINEWDMDVAREWYEFNISTAYLGEYTPILVYNMV